MIFQISNRKIPVRNRSEKFPVLAVGDFARNSKQERLIFRDSTGLNISDLNHDFSELTGHYWVWKNYDFSNDELVGFFHHRRYFNFAAPLLNHHKVLVEGLERCIDFFCVETQYIAAAEILRYCDFITIRAEYNDPLDTRWPSHHPPKLWALLKDVLANDPLKQYRPDLFFSLHRRLVWYPMFVTTPDLFNRISFDLFRVLFNIRSVVDKNRKFYGVDDDNSRYLAYLSEPLLMFLVHSYGLRCFEAQVVVSEVDNIPSRLVMKDSED